MGGYILLPTPFFSFFLPRERWEGGTEDAVLSPVGRLGRVRFRRERVE